jgi:peroxiredoxin
LPFLYSFTLPWPLAVGDTAPAWVMPSSSGKQLGTADCLGRPLVLCFLPAEALAAADPVVLAFRDLAADFQEAGVRLAVAVAAPESACAEAAARLGLPFPVLADADGNVSRVHLTTDDAAALDRRTFVFDAAFRVARLDDRPSSASHAPEVLEFVRGMVGREEPRHVLVQAPVLLIPDVIPPDLCRELIAVWEGENEDSGFMTEVEGKTVGVYDHAHKVRRDHFLREGPRRDRLNQLVGHRVRPWIRKAFRFDVTRFEDFRIACYDSDRGGYFRPHRDNTTTGTAHRVFAMTLNLNAGEYEGGSLRFPEFGPHLYRPRTGEAVVFSCALLHEATDVTAGRRFVLLSFFYGEQEAKRREEMARRAAGESPAG